MPFNKPCLFFLLFCWIIIGCSTAEKDDDITAPEEVIPPINHDLRFKQKYMYADPGELTLYCEVRAENVTYEYSFIENNLEWIDASKGNNSFTFTLKHNISGIDRSCHFVVTDTKNNLSDTLSINQPMHWERFALIQIFNALNGPNWINKKNWCTDNPLSTWDGIIANEKDEVTRLWIVKDAHVEGELPDCIAYLKNLDNLTIEDTNLRGSFPSAVGELKNLQRIVVDYNRLSGEIPAELSNCSALEFLSLSNNELSGSVPDLFSLEHIKHIDLSNNKLNSFEIKKIHDDSPLTHLFLNNNFIESDLPPNIFKLKSLGYCFLNNNKIKGKIPENIGEAMNLFTLDLSYNNIEGPIPDTFNQNCLLANLGLRNNFFTGKLPDCFENLHNLKSMSIRENNLIEIGEKAKLNAHYTSWSVNPQRGNKIIK